MSSLKVVKTRRMSHLIYIVKMRGIDPGNPVMAFKRVCGLHWKGIFKYKCGSVRKTAIECDINWAKNVMMREANE